MNLDDEKKITRWLDINPILSEPIEKQIGNTSISTLLALMWITPMKPEELIDFLEKNRVADDYNERNIIWWK